MRASLCRYSESYLYGVASISSGISATSCRYYFQQGSCGFYVHKAMNCIPSPSPRNNDTNFRNELLRYASNQEVVMVLGFKQFNKILIGAQTAVLYAQANL